MNTYIWFAIMAGSILVEISTSNLVSIWFAPAALISMILSLFDVNTVFQIITFLVSSVAFLILFYKKLRDNIATKSEKTSVYSDKEVSTTTYHKR